MCVCVCGWWVSNISIKKRERPLSLDNNDNDKIKKKKRATRIETYISTRLQIIGLLGRYLINLDRLFHYQTINKWTFSQTLVHAVIKRSNNSYARQLIITMW